MSAKIGRKSNIFDTRQLVIFHCENGKLYREIAAMLNLSKSTVADIIRRFKHEDRIESIPQTGRSKGLNDKERRQIITKVQKHPRLSAPKLAIEVSQETGKQVHP